MDDGMTDKPNLLGLHEVASRIGVAYETARRWASAGMIPAFKFHEGGHWVAHANDIDEFIERRKNPTAGRN